jgi:hypothetical protein
MICDESVHTNLAWSLCLSDQATVSESLSDSDDTIPADGTSPIAKMFYRTLLHNHQIHVPALRAVSV